MDLRYPIGEFHYVGELDSEVVEGWKNDIASLPKLMREAVSGLTEEQLDLQYRPEGWTVRQVVHHVVDSHLNAFTRFKFALTEDNPVIKPYDEARWAELTDYNMPIENSLVMLDSLHIRWSHLLRSLTTKELNRTFIHPASGEIPLWKNIGIYSWHGRHHTAHITSLRERLGF
ncbi:MULTISPECIES: YfiT family bacillithiol transferase [unclassified Bacillus (in: firmicutes)]|uniref:YfiT family bacillithiol transferase n=1 Tax=unclassified Bacillus (in: firmicutes) TaxID=185979 RepID=UPI0008E3CB90|nr:MULTISPECIES: putative metal-dependent hydrolase [unclassified Bacillus (in: firmicutes)]SFA85702.1 DinB superfamily protein [Bacillus sp. UNCCL13]SFQ83504.1 DinB superfamily protein [Bacillus sp. cl95]